MRGDFHAALFAEAETWLTTPYCHQARRKHVGTDCLGFIMGLYAHFSPLHNMVPPAYELDPQFGEGEVLWQAAQQYLIEQTRSNPMPGQVLLFRMQPHLPARHLGLLLPHNQFIHAAQNLGVVKTRYGRWWSRRLVAAFSFPPFNTNN